MRSQCSVCRGGKNKHTKSDLNLHTVCGRSFGLALEKGGVRVIVRGLSCGVEHVLPEGLELWRSLRKAFVAFAALDGDLGRS